MSRTPLLALLLSAQTLPAAEVMTWVPPYRVKEARTVLGRTSGVLTPDRFLSRIGLQFWVPTAQGGVAFATHEEKVGDGDVAWFRDWAKARGVKTLLCVFNHNGQRWDWETARSAFRDHRETFIRALLAEMERLQLDGIDLDLEGNGFLDADRAAFAAFVADLSPRVHARGRLLTVDSFHSPCANAPNMGWWADWAGKIDTIHSMGYGDLAETSTEGFTPEGKPPCLGGAPIFRFSWQVAWAATTGHRPDQLLLGLPGGRFEWAGQGLPAHLRDAARQGAGICIWDVHGLAGGGKDDRWGSPAAWSALTHFRSSR